MFVNFSEEVKHLIKQAERQKKELNHPYVGTEHLLLSILKDNYYKDIFEKQNITYDSFKNKLIGCVGTCTKKCDFLLYTPMLKNIIENCVIKAREEYIKNVTPEILLITLLDEEKSIAVQILKSMEANVELLYKEIKNKKISKMHKKKRTILEENGVDLLKLAKEGKIDPVIGREKEINNTIEILLRRKKNNPILIGPAGVGKTAIIEGIANIMISKDCPNALKNKRLISLNIFELVSGTKYRGEFEDKMKNLIIELEENQDIILFIDEIHTLVGAGGAEGAIDASNILKPALARGNVKIIGATTVDEYKKYFEQDAALTRRFQTIYVEEPSFDKVVDILKHIKPLYEKYHNISIDDKLLYKIVDLSNIYLKNRCEPDRSIDVLDEVCAKVSTIENKWIKNKKRLLIEYEKVKSIKNVALKNKDFKLACNYKKQENKLMKDILNIKEEKNKVRKIDIINVIKDKSNLKIFYKENKTFYNDLKNKLKSDIYGQDDVINILIDSLEKRNLLKKNGCYSILINGSKNTGKKTLANKYANIITNKNNIINIDASEYYSNHMISKLIGTSVGYIGYDSKNNIFDKVRFNPNSVLIIENYNDSCIEFKNIFNHILKYNYIEDAKGIKIDFSNSTIIFIEEKSKEKLLGFTKMTNEEKKKNTNFSLVINMNDLNEDIIKKIILNKLSNFVNKYKHIRINISEDVVNNIFIKLENDLNNLSYIIEKELEQKILDNIVINK